eukprot:TRINITY_DN62787_c0_g1_i1.p1 TRINITY_DN62787_c0_g1~~TRINITY_DN62787_c0_g1_i1.p1  ORF type:complete len:1040 (+),score=220.78 TRINITY_DN62787_c0_g1_i1:393-3122(+)
MEEPDSPRARRDRRPSNAPSLASSGEANTQRKQKRLRRKTTCIRNVDDRSSNNDSGDTESHVSLAMSKQSLEEVISKEAERISRKVNSRAYDNNRKVGKAEHKLMQQSRHIAKKKRRANMISPSPEPQVVGASNFAEGGAADGAAGSHVAKQQGESASLISEEPEDLMPYLGKVTPLKWAITVVIAVFVALQAGAMILGSFYIGQWKLDVMEQVISKGGGHFFGFCFLLLYALPVCLLSAVLVVFVAPHAGGSGIPEIKAFLNGIVMPGAFGFKAWLCRSIGLVFVTSAGLFAGTEGPFAHIGGIVASWFADGPACLGFSWWWPPVLKGHRNRCEFVSQGCAIGVAAGFGAPVGGILFSLEEASTYWSKSLTWQAFLGTMIAAVLAKVTKSGFTTLNTSGFIEFPDKDASFDFWELLTFAALAIVTGLLGALFVNLVKRTTMFRRSFFQLRAPTKSTKRARLCEVILVVIFSTAICFWPALAMGCKPLDAGAADTHHLRRLMGGEHDGPPDVSGGLCEKRSSYSAMGAILLLPKEAAIKALFSKDMADGAILDTASLLWSYLIIYFTTILTFGCALPVGLFVPNILAGACLGRAFGTILAAGGLAVHEGVYALMGAAGCLAGFSRVTISLAVIFLEITNNVYLLLPLMEVIMLSKVVADRFGPSVYDLVLELNPDVHLLEDALQEDQLIMLQDLTVHDACTSDVVVLREYEPLKQIVAVLLQSSFSAYPVVDNKDRLLGLVMRTSLATILTEKDVENSSELVCVRHLAEEAPEVTLWNNSVIRAFDHFRAGGLQHLCVVDELHVLLGIITRTDLSRLCQSGHEGMEEVQALINRKNNALQSGRCEDGATWRSQSKDMSESGASDDGGTDNDTGSDSQSGSDAEHGRAAAPLRVQGPALGAASEQGAAAG